MKTKLSLILGILISLSGFSQRFQYFSWSFYGQGSALSNYRTVSVQPKAYFSGGVDYGTSLTNSLNIKFGVHYLESFINNDKQFHSLCDQPDNSCFVESDVNYINFPLGIEMYSNSSRIKNKSYYNIRLIPMFSMEELVIKSEIFDEPEVHLDIDSSLNTNFKFQDLHFEFALGTDISLSRKLKLYFEPSIQHSIFMRKEDLVNPNYMISFRLGLRVRSYKR